MNRYVTSEGLEKLKKELKELEKSGRKEVAEKIHKAAELGDISDNAQYQEAKKEQGFLEGRILELKNIIANAKIISNNGSGGGKVEIGSVVLVKIDGSEQSFSITGETGSDPLNGKISYQAPLGKALLDRKKGDSFIFRAPQGEMEVEVIKIK